ncbi:hypothetical protein [Nonomuraea montanisoli]|uniref:hypothetical protein n=1 Tax=Nonomuraea montanisoli TaxID=2741721 RepID=UPI0019660F13|nr:hypothetical protein [Nonomuraea montanisoli]
MMGRILLVIRLALRDLRRRRTETAPLLIALLAATTTLTLGLVLRDAAGDPYRSTRAATAGPDVVANAHHTGLAELGRPATASGVTAHSGPYPVIAGKLEASGRTSDVQVEGRDTTVAAVDQPRVTRGGWVSAGGVVLEAAFAGSLDVGVGDPDHAQAFVDRAGGDQGGAMPMRTWQSILADATDLARDSQILLLIGAWLLGLLAVASLSVLVGGRMADQH